jgi:hypothetical protein
MALTKIRGNQISTATNATVDALAFLDGESSLVIPVGNTAQRPGTATGTTVTVGTIRYNSELNNNGGQAEIYVANDGTGNAGWTAVGGGGASLGRGGVIRSNADFIDEDLDINPSLDDKFTNAFTRGPIEIRDTYTVTVSGDADWEIWGGEPEDPIPGTILQYLHAQTPATRQTIQSDNISDVAARITGLSIDITPTRSTSKIIVSACVSHTLAHVVSFGFQKDGNALQTGLNNGSNNTNTPYAVKTSYNATENTDETLVSITYSYEFGSSDFTPGVEMTIQAAATASWGGSIRTLYINDRNSTGTVQDMRSISTMSVMEVMG